MEEKVIEKTTEAIDRIMKEGIATTNIDNLYKLSKIKHLAKEDKEMYGEYGNYGEYGARRGGRRGGYGEYGNYGEYGARRGGRRYRGDDYMDRMSEEYGRYQESRSRYGDSEETDRSFHYMVKALEDFIKVLDEEADTPQQKQQLKTALQNAMR